jgi:hypothetical protein
MARLLSKGNKPGRVWMVENVAKDATATDTRQAQTEEGKAIKAVKRAPGPLMRSGVARPRLLEELLQPVRRTIRVDAHGMLEPTWGDGEVPCATKSEVAVAAGAESAALGVHRVNSSLEPRIAVWTPRSLR